MSKSSNLNVRLDPLVKEQAENILTQLGMPMASAVSIFLQQVVLQNGLPFEVKLPTAKPIAYGSLTDTEFNALMEKSFTEYENGEVLSNNAVKMQVNRKYGIWVIG